MPKSGTPLSSWSFHLLFDEIPQWPGYISKELMTSGKALQSYTVTIHDLCSVLAWFLLKSTAFCKENILSTSSKLLHPETSLVQAPNLFLPCTHAQTSKIQGFHDGKAMVTPNNLGSLNSRSVFWGFFRQEMKEKQLLILLVLPIAATTVWKFLHSLFSESLIFCNEKIRPSWWILCFTSKRKKPERIILES